MKFIVHKYFEIVGFKAIEKLVDIIDSTIPVPPRDLDKPFYLPIETTHSIPGELM